VYFALFPLFHPPLTTVILTLFYLKKINYIRLKNPKHMNITAKLTAITGLLFLFVSCTSDDNKTELRGKKQYLLTEVNYTAYKANPMQAGDFTLNYTPEYREPEFTVSLSLTYDTDKQLSELLVTKNSYGNETNVEHHVYTYKPVYNDSQQIKTLTISSQENSTSQYSFSYEDGQLKTLQVRDNDRISYDQQFVYNNLKQFTHATVQTIKNEPQTIELDYTHNAANQLVRLTNGNEATDFSYDTGKNPFDALPFDLTTLILDNIDFVPLTYKFTNTLTSYKLSTEEQPYLLEHVYNEDNYIIGTIIYRGTKVLDKHYMLIKYKYEVTTLE